MLRIWFVFLFVSFLVSVLTMTRIQTRVANATGWRALRGRPLLKTYWADISPTERALLWCGVMAFLFTVLGAGIARLFARAA